MYITRRTFSREKPFNDLQTVDILVGLISCIIVSSFRRRHRCRCWCPLTLVSLENFSETHPVFLKIAHCSWGHGGGSWFLEAFAHPLWKKGLKGGNMFYYYN